MTTTSPLPAIGDRVLGQYRPSEPDGYTGTVLGHSVFETPGGVLPGPQVYAIVLLDEGDYIHDGKAFVSVVVAHPSNLTTLES